tara:strand:+ start:4462 stop:5148 length:687 start_codon:yes stop_codon:yes gene_type:complete
MKVICTICARKNSKGVKNKALKNLCGKPLIAHTILQAKKSKIFNHVVVSTDSIKIQKIAIQYGADSWFLRPKRLSKKNSSKESAIRHALLEAEKKYKEKYDVCIDLDITSPLRKVSDIKNAFKNFKNKNSSVLFSVTKSRKNPYFNMVEETNNIVNLVKKPNKIIHSRQNAPSVFDMNASIYIWKRHKILKSDNLYGAKTSIYEMPLDRSIDIDEEVDFKIVKMLFKK